MVAGEMVTTDGKVIGEHAGVHNFTVGQRKGLGVATGSPLYVIQIKNDTRQVVVGKDEELYSRTLRARRVNLISTAELREPMRVAVKIRHKHQPAPAIIEPAGNPPGRTKSESPLMSRSAPSLRARPPFSTMATSSSAAAGSKTPRRTRWRSKTPSVQTAVCYRDSSPTITFAQIHGTFVG